MDSSKKFTNVIISLAVILVIFRRHHVRAGHADNWRIQFLSRSGHSGTPLCVRRHRVADRLRRLLVHP